MKSVIVSLFIIMVIANAIFAAPEGDLADSPPNADPALVTAPVPGGDLRADATFWPWFGGWGGGYGGGWGGYGGGGWGGYGGWGR